ncbi:XRE family transcriptional regulator [Marinicauda algicola]|uniref:XRE family transcriptional regulator n=1 Tax=Marinicauda algicola TaxID=2029849 RepID=A0A4S2GZE7_9PROT|nr:helix-turn-helix transcriptional regulator [Marinicauda algicola]TGY88368.1 XRE family transcriptional regulator [Marinicauda algicola]
MKIADFSDKLGLVLKALVMSRTALASALNVDKSLVGRWVAGSVHPSEHNLALLSRYVGERIEGFTLIDWERTLPDFAERLGVDLPDIAGPAGRPGDWLPESIYEESVRNTRQRGSAYEGIWRSTRASHDLPGRFIHDITMIEWRGRSRLHFTAGVEGVRYHGRALLLGHQIFTSAADAEHGSMMFGIYNGVARQRAQVLDGMSLTTLRDAGASPACSVVVLERIADLTGDEAVDRGRFEQAVADLVPLAPEGSIAPDLAAHLTRVPFEGAPGVMRLFFGQSMARGASVEALLGRPA